MSSEGQTERHEENVRDLIRAAQLRQAERELAALLQTGRESGEGIRVTKSYWARKREVLNEGAATIPSCATRS